MLKKSFKWISVSIITLLCVGFSVFFIGCSNKNNANNENNTENTGNTNNIHVANSIPNSNVFEDIASYLSKNTQNQNNGIYVYYIIGNPTSTKSINLAYNSNTNQISMIAEEANVGGFELILNKNTNFSKATHTIRIGYPFNSQPAYNSIVIPAKEYVDLNTTTQLTEYQMNEASTLTKEQERQILTQLSPMFSQAFTEFSNFYANTIKNDQQYLGATYKYFYLPVLK